MASLAVNGVFALLILGVWYALISEGLWGSMLMFFNVLFASLIAFNFYEPLAQLLADNVEFMSGYADATCLIVLFIVTLFILRLTTESLAPTMVRYPTAVYHLGRITFALGGALIAVAMVLLAFHTSPVHKKMFGVIDYKAKPPWGLGLDHGWLAFMQYTTGYIFTSHSDERPVDPEFGTANAFDREGKWLIVHQNARPYGEERVPEPEGGAAQAAGGAAGGEGQGQGQQGQGGPAGPGQGPAGPGQGPGGPGQGPGGSPGGRPPG